MSNDLANLKTLYTATKNTLLDHPLSATERSTFQTQLTALTPLGQTKQETALIDAYRELVAANLSFPIHGLFLPDEYQRGSHNNCTPGSPAAGARVAGQ
ncbi:hypothetical protein [Secundilactobacillus collinoides]|uniref:hypothetical protein n=1 Tax=Secundilactobacillus collinoides TaxID=33960 RepID=UPI0006D0B699|nr:hypothetical protein [Secundilactobacillus collinoides]